jgi:hypothetical protein
MEVKRQLIALVSNGTKEWHQNGILLRNNIVKILQKRIVKAIV